MASDIDDLLEFLRAIETCTRDYGIASQAERPARWIAAVEELRHLRTGEFARLPTRRGVVTTITTESGNKISYVRRRSPETGDGK